jgi:putative Mg2+ transporter-C (MgtC) family protein
MQLDSSQLIFRIICAGLCGILVGFERQYRSKEAGIRTHFMVACGAALMMIISKYAFYDVITDSLLSGADVRLDPSRVASTIVSGVGFLGAGTIFVHKNTITGLTTAAGLWATAGIGMAFGSGMYVIGFSTTAIMILSQLLLHMNFKLLRGSRIKKLIISGVARNDYQSYLSEFLLQHQIRVQDTRIKKNSDGTRNYTFIIDTPQRIAEEEILSWIEYECEITPYI